MKNTFLYSFNQFILQKKLCHPKQRILVAVSGGIDSVLMATLFKQAGYNIAIAHLNFCLRGKESDDDQQFVKRLALKLDVPFFTINCDTKKEAERQRKSIQMVARDIRYGWLEEIRKKNKFHAIAIAHHLNDITETILINLLRGTGLSGLHGILPISGKIIRPLLFSTRDEIVAYAKEKKISWREDSSNISDDYTRNLIRHHILPVFKKINPSYEKTFGENANRFFQSELIVKEYIDNLKREVMFSDDKQTHKLIKVFFSLHPAGANILFELIKEFGFSSSVINDIITAAGNQPGKKFYSSTHQLVSDRDFFIISPMEISSDEVVMQEFPDHLEIKQQDFVLKIFPLILDKKSYRHILKNKEKNIAYADAGKIKLPFTVRTWQHGDFFYPFGMKGKKKLSDFYVDLKLSLTQKEKTWLLNDSEKIIWIMGYRLDNRVAIDQYTKNCYRFEFCSE